MKLAKLSVQRPIAMSMVIFLVLILGVVSLRNMTVDLFPELTFPVAAVAVTYEGAGPEEIENLVTGPIENVMGTIPNVEDVSSVSRVGGALVIVSFKWGTDMDFATLNMREKIDTVREFLPRDAKAPRVLRFNPSDFPILQLAVTAPNGNSTEAKKIAEEEIKPLLDSIDGVASVNIEGGEEKEIRLTIDQNKLASYQLTVTQLQQIIGSENLNWPSGTLSDQNYSLPIKIEGNFTSIQDVKSLPIPTTQGVIRLEDLADIKETTKPITQVSYLNGEPSVGISILKQSGANTVQVSGEIKDQLDELRKTLPKGAKIKPIFDQSRFITQSIKDVSWNMVFGSVLAGAVLYFFLRNFRSTLIVAFSIPISIITTFVFMYFSGETINLLTLGGLALGVGMMVDNSIVILENVYRLRQSGYSIKDAAIEGTSEVGTAVIASTLTTVVVFLPIVFVEGLAAQLFKPLAWVVTFSLLASLFTALIIVPLLSSLLMKVRKNESDEKERLHRVKAHYLTLLERALHHPKRTLSITGTALLLSLAGFPLLGQEFLPAQDQSFISITARLPEGSALGATETVSKEIDQRLEPLKEIDLSYVTIGGSDNFSMSAGTGYNRASYSILLVPPDKRSKTDLEVADDIRERLKDIPNAKISVSGSDSGFNGSPVSLSITGPDLDVLRKVADDTVKIISKVKGVREPASNFTTGSPEIFVKIDREKASRYGIGSAQIAQAVNDATKGVTASRLSRNGEELDIRIAIDETATTSITELSNLLLEAPTGEKIPLGSIAEVKHGVGPNQISRMNRLREITVTADILDRDLGSVNDDIEAELKENLHLPTKEYKVTFGGQDEQMKDAFFKLSGALALAVVFVYMVMAGQFESFFYPFVIMFSVPLTIIGVMIGLLSTGQPLGVGSLVGLLILTGIVVNNAIILVDYTNTLKSRGYTTMEALLEAGPTRLRPILMTALTTILGLIPLTLGIGEGTEIQQPMAIVIVFGLSFATLITLIFIPVVYSLMDKRKEKRRLKHASLEEIVE